MKIFQLTLLLLLLPFFTYCQEYDDYIGAGHSIGVTASSSDSQSNPMQSVNGAGHDLDIQGASRFLSRTSLGYTIEDVEHVVEIGFEQWIEEQLELEPEYLTLPTISTIFQLYNACLDELGPACLLEFNLDVRSFRYSWWDNFMNGEDMLRQRIALALSEILVISDKSMLGQAPHGLANYYDILTRHAFGNYRDILFDVTMNPSMGFYLSHMNNPRTFPELNIRPDENYAREIMQLFSIGLYELNQDGSRKTDPETGLWIETYNNDDIKGLAKVFTGLSGSKWADESDTSPVEFGRRFNRYSLVDPMIMYPFFHEAGEKTIVGGYTIPNGQDPMKDIEDAIDHLFNHENVGPFLATRLIQRLVKSNPTPQYVSRVAGVFNDNGSGVRGDMEAMIKAILLDNEAKECFWFGTPQNGMLKAPILRLTQMMKGIKAETPNGIFWNSGSNFENFTGQHPLGSPTVFNFYSPEYVPNAEFAYESLEGPEFQILNSSTSSNYVNYMLVAIMGDFLWDYLNLPPDERFGNYLNEYKLIPYISNKDEYAATLEDPNLVELSSSPEEWIDYLDILLTDGQLSNTTKERIAESMKREDLFDPMTSALYGLYMVMINPEFVIMK